MSSLALSWLDTMGIEVGFLASANSKKNLKTRFADHVVKTSPQSLVIRNSVHHRFNSEPTERSDGALSAKDIRRISIESPRKITQLKGMGASSARKDRPRIEPVFLTDAAESFNPVYTLKGIEP
jgi:hypothetical protein